MPTVPRAFPWREKVSGGVSAGVSLAAAFLVAACSPPRRHVGEAADGARPAPADAALESGNMGCRIRPVAALQSMSPGSTGGGGTSAAAACGDVVTTIIDETCVGGICHHAGPVQAAHLDLFSPCVADRLVGVVSTCNGRLLVDPAVPERSFVLDKLEHDMPECGESMPFDNHLPDVELECMRQWVLAIAARR